MERSAAKSFMDLVVWQKAHALTLTVYRGTKHFPKEEVYGLTSQIRRASASVGSNIAEGFKKREKKDKARIMNIAQGSLEEVRYFMILSRDLEYHNFKNDMPLLEEVSKLLEAYINSILKSIS
jgi:four helix bundle protein